MRKRSALGVIAGFGAIAACVSSSVTVPTTRLSLTGTYAGLQEGTHAGVAFRDDILQLTIIQENDSLNGQWESLFGGVGLFAATILPSDTILEFSFQMTQTAPCDGEFEGTGEARVGVRGNGATTIGIGGSYTGSDCDGDIMADFFVTRN